MSSDGTCVLIASPSALFSASGIQHELYGCNHQVLSLSFSLCSLLYFQGFKHYKRNTLLIVLWARLLIVFSHKSEMKTQVGLEQVRAASSLKSQEN